jgi:hypothetical protein
MLSLNEIVKSDLRDFIVTHQTDPWIGNPLEGYVHIDNGNKGKFGEMFVEKYMTLLGYQVDERTDPGHDRVIDGMKIEIKFSLANRHKGIPKKDLYLINHISVDKDWDRLIFFGINPVYNESRFFFFDKSDFVENLDHLKREKIVYHQQSGNRGGLDDFVVQKYGVPKLHSQPWVYDIHDWNKSGEVAKNNSEGLW